MGKIDSKKLEIYILTGIAVILSLYIFLRGDENLNYTIPNIEIPELAELDSITFNDFTLKNSGNIWTLPNEFEVSEEVLNTIDRKLKNFEIIDKISERDEDQRFGMDSPGNLILSAKNGVSLEVRIGSVSSSGSYTYVKIPGENGIYSVRGDITELFSSNPDDLRSKIVLKANNISSVVVKKNDTEITKDGESLKDLDFLNKIEASNFKDLPRSEQLLSLSIIDEDGEKSLIIYNEQNGEYPGTSSEVNFPFTLTKYTVDKLLAIE